jgi:hypothetical protein
MTAIKSLSEVRGLDYPAFLVAIANLNIVEAEWLLEQAVYPSKGFTDLEKMNISVLFNIEAEKVRLLLRRNVVWDSVKQLEVYEAMVRKPLAECEDWHCNFNITPHHKLFDKDDPSSVYCYRHGGDPGDLEEFDEFSIEEQNALMKQELLIKHTVTLAGDEEVSEITAIATKQPQKKCHKCKEITLHWGENIEPLAGRKVITCLHCLWIIYYNEVSIDDEDADI